MEFGMGMVAVMVGILVVVILGVAVVIPTVVRLVNNITNELDPTTKLIVTMIPTFIGLMLLVWIAMSMFGGRN
jgi:type II secretory pathway component PulF